MVLWLSPLLELVDGTESVGGARGRRYAALLPSDYIS